MRRSNIGLFIILGVVAVLIIVTIIGARLIIGNIFDAVTGDNAAAMQTSADNVETTVLEYDMKDFDEISIDGAWSVNVRQSEDFSISVQCPVEIKDLIKVKKRGDTLYFEDILHLKRFKTGSIKADINMPTIDHFEVDGAASIYLFEFNQDTINLDVNGAATIRGEKNIFNNIEIDVKGAGNVNFGKSETVNADIDIDGVGNVIVSITGGTLSGSIDGLGKVEYYGEISNNKMDIQGLGKIKKIE